MARGRAVLLVLLCSAAGAGCGALISSAAEGMADNLGKAILNQPDPAVVRDGMPAYLLLLDSMVVQAPESPAILGATAELYAAYGVAFVSDNQRARRLTRRARSYGARAICAAESSACEWPGLNYEALVAGFERVDGDAIGAFYSYSISWLAYLRAHSDDWDALAELPHVEAALNRLLILDESYQEGSVHRYMGVLKTLRPPALGGKPDEAREHFERAIALSGGRDLSVKVDFARSYARLLYERELHDRLLTEVLEGDAEIEGYVLFNALARQEAQVLLDTADDYF